MPSNETEVLPALTALTKKRTTIKRRITRCFNSHMHSDENIQSQSADVIKSLLDGVNALKTDFDQLQHQIENIIDESDMDNDELSEKHADERMTIETSFFKLTSPLQQRLHELRNKQTRAQEVPAVAFSLPTPTSSVGSHQLSSRLPEIKLPEFSGNINNWLSFCQLFHSLIDVDDRLTDAQRLLYLKTCVKGEAYNAIASLPPVAENYQVAWTLLRSRYDNKRVLIKTHLNNLLFQLPSHTNESASSLRHLIDVVTTNLTALTTLGLPTHHWDEILIHIIQVKIDKLTQRDWEQNVGTQDSVTFDKLKTFLHERCATLEVLSSSAKHNQSVANSSGAPNITRSGNRYNQGFTNAHRVNSATLESPCPLCKGQHRLFTCRKFLDYSTNERKRFLDSDQRCHNCFWPNHTTSACTYGACKLCHKAHHTLLHEQNTPSTSSVRQSAANVYHSRSSISSERNEEFLPTAIVHAYDVDGNAHPCRALFDSGSQCNFVRTDLMQRLRLPTTKTNIQIATIGNKPSRWSTIGTITIASRLHSFSLSVSSIVVEQITSNLPSQTYQFNRFELPAVELADPEFAHSQPIDLLIGVSAFWNCMRPNSYKATNTHPHLQDTLFGWIVGGRILNNVQSDSSTFSSNLAIQTTPSMPNLHDAVAQMFRLENDTVPKLTPADDASEAHYKNTHVYCPITKRFTVRLPFTTDRPILGDSYKSALRRFHALESRLKRSSELRDQYHAFMAEYLSLQHMSLGNAASAKYYLPHHGVVRNDKTTTKLRVVFDASAKTTNSLSLNDTLRTGPTIQSDLLSILLRFRTYQYVLCADVEKMYRQVQLDPRDRPYQSILWRDSDGRIQTYFLNTVTYGITCAPYLAIKTLQQTVKFAPSTESSASQAILHDFYVDDLLTGADSKEEACMLKSSIHNILLEGGFNLRKWSSNHVDISENAAAINLDKDQVAKLLGIQWNSTLDQIKYSFVHSGQASSIPTKRTILSLASKLFDPLGLVTPIVIVSKLILRQLWTSKLDWDDPIPQDIHERWSNYISELPMIQTISITRKTICARSHRIELHGFCDASQMAYGAAIYIRSIDSQNILQTHLLCSKSRVAPIKIITIPRLELCAAVLLVQLMDKVKGTLRQTTQTSYYWTDSTIVLHWIIANKKHKQIFVANRISEIQSLSDPMSWRHVRTNENPADIITRGCAPAELAHNKLWWHGPSWLALAETNWPAPTLPQSTVHTVIINEHWTTLRKFSHLPKLIRVLCYCIRFGERCNKRGGPTTLKISVEELINARSKLLCCVQREGLPQTTSTSFGTGDLKSLNPFVDNHGLLRVGGRLSHNTSLTYDKRHPIILPRNHYVTKLIIRHEHERLLHAGAAHTLSSLRETYWPLSAKSQVRAIIHACIPCRRAHPRVLNQIMGDLPTARITPARPFLNSGVDYAGPIHLVERRGRGRRSTKAYIALFVCFATKAIHIELVSDCSSAAFLAAVRRFIARRGMVAHLYSDNGTNFKGATTELKELYDMFKKESFDTVTSKLSRDHINWHFIPPNSPHWGGLWEAGIKTVKSHIKRVIGDQILTFEEYSTLLTQIEACVNSRPICELSSDPNDLLPLTPAHFLIGNSLTSIAEPTYLDVPTNRLTRWQLFQQMVQHFWKRWSQDYLHQLQQRPKWQQMKTNITPGTLVLLREHNLPPFVWVMGRIVECYKGHDDVVRTVLVRTATGTYKRTINRLSLLLNP